MGGYAPAWQELEKKKQYTKPAGKNPALFRHQKKIQGGAVWGTDRPPDASRKKKAWPRCCPRPGGGFTAGKGSAGKTDLKKKKQFAKKARWTRGPKTGKITEGLQGRLPADLKGRGGKKRGHHFARKNSGPTLGSRKNGRRQRFTKAGDPPRLCPARSGRFLGRTKKKAVEIKGTHHRKTVGLKDFWQKPERCRRKDGAKRDFAVEGKKNKFFPPFTEF